MSRPKLSYFDFPGGRGEECRLALHLAGVAFDDERIKGTDWPARKAGMPFQAMPVLEIDGRRLSQSNAILGYIGRAHGLLPDDPWEAARHMQFLEACEELRQKLAPVLRIKGEEEKIAARSAMVEETLRPWGANIDRLIGDGPFVGGETPSVADIKLNVLLRWFVEGGVDHVPPTVFADAPRLMGVYEAVKNHPKVLAWYAK